MTHSDAGLTDDEETIAIPRSFLTGTLPAIVDPAEIHVSLAVFRLAAAGGGFEHAVGERKIVRDAVLRKSLRIEGSSREPDQRIAHGLDLAVGRGTLAKVATIAGDEQRIWYYVNSPANRALIERARLGLVAPPLEIWHDDTPPRVEPVRPTVYRLYEQNIGALTPLIADRILNALELYSPEWIAEAIEEAVAYNKRNWRYISRILENWALAGRGQAHTGTSTHETHRRRDPDALDPDQYKDGRYLRRTGGRPVSDL